MAMPAYSFIPLNHFMKNSLSRQASKRGGRIRTGLAEEGFTLIELLVVIATGAYTTGGVHAGRNNVLYADGHVEPLESPPRIIRRATPPKARGIRSGDMRI
jgi:prepilin-type processing-associated H-X9-DG protein